MKIFTASIAALAIGITAANPASQLYDAVSGAYDTLSQSLNFRISSGNIALDRQQNILATEYEAKLHRLETLVADYDVYKSNLQCVADYDELTKMAAALNRPIDFPNPCMRN
jgi:hypothetical protein